ncbi:unnamed protein product [Notodromas monacha]|uniref:Uncharacterized protein n=1 Tax=Notodromas monacha TaxID=399045 RepID=A0A7R9BV62_9CRUS|nr:unnamed protein product [Notodromas monacha]CAG0922346.1 unnamed protein product [Notodromas monacha]
MFGFRATGEIMSRRPVDSWAGAAIGTVHGARAVKNDVYLDNSLDSGVDGMRDSPNNSAEDLPDYITDAPNNITYLRGKFLGKISKNATMS